MAKLWPQAAVGLSELLEVGGACRDQEAQRHQEVSFSLFSGPVGHQLLEQQSCRPRQPHALTLQVDLGPGGDERKGAEYEQGQSLILEDICLGRILGKIHPDEVHLQQLR